MAKRKMDIQTVEVTTPAEAAQPSSNHAPKVRATSWWSYLHPTGDRTHIWHREIEPGIVCYIESPKKGTRGWDAPGAEPLGCTTQHNGTLPPEYVPLNE